MKNILIISGLILIIVLIYSCRKDKPALPVVTTTDVNDISWTTATSGGEVKGTAQVPLICKGVCWSDTISEPTIANSKTVQSSSTGVFTSFLTGLSPNTQYHIRAYATSSAGTAYGDTTSFTTLPSAIPLLTTDNASSITATSTICGGIITTDNGASIIERGVCWDTLHNPIILKNKIISGTGTGTFTVSITGLKKATTYYLKAYAINIEGTAYGNEISFTTGTTVPFILTNVVYPSSFTTNIVSIITDDGGATVNSRGVCWSSSQSPTISDNKTTDGSGTGSFVSRITGLTTGTTYFARSYATNSAGTAYGSQVSFTTTPTVTDKDGNMYNTVTIGTQTWMGKNLKTTHFNDGAPISLVTDQTTWYNLHNSSTPAYCWYNNDSLTNKPDYGALYNWYTVGTGKLCPFGWHVSSYDEWVTLINYLGGGSVYPIYPDETAAIKVIETGNAHWIDWDGPNTATNESGFTALPGSLRADLAFASSWMGKNGFWWTATFPSGSFSFTAYRIRLYGPRDMIFDYINFDPKHWGLSVRCLKDYM